MLLEQVITRSSLLFSLSFYYSDFQTEKVKHLQIHGIDSTTVNILPRSLKK